MKGRAEGWRTMRSMEAARTPAAAVLPEEAVPQPAPAPSLHATRSLGRRLLDIASRVSSVQWSLALIGILGYVFAITTYRLPIGAVSAALALAGVFLLQGRIRFPLPMVLLTAFLVWCTLSATFSTWRLVSFPVIWELLKVVLIFFAMLNALRTRSQEWVFVAFYLLCFATHPARGAIFNYFVGGTIFGRASWYVGSYTNPNDLAAYTLLAISMAAAFAATMRWGLVKVGALAAIGVLPFVVLITQSRGASLGLGLFVVLAILGFRRKALGFLGLAAVGAALVLVSPQGVWDRLSGLKNVSISNDMAQVDPEGSAEQRFDLVKNGLVIIAHHPVLGTGPGTIALANGMVSDALAGRDAHNTYISVAAETGLVGLALFLSLVASVFLYSRRTRLRCRHLLPDGARQLRYLELGLVVFLFVSVFGSYSKVAFFYVHLGLVYAFAQTLETEYRTLARLSADPRMLAPRG